MDDGTAGSTDAMIACAPPANGSYPHGEDRPSLLLSLDDGADEHRDRILGLAQHLFSAVLVGNPAPLVAAMCERMRNPVPGDLVAERSAAMYSRNADDRLHGLGYLIVTRQEWLSSDAEWEANRAEWGDDALDARGDRPHQDVWYVQYGQDAGDVARWANCTFIALPGLGDRWGEVPR